MTKLPTSSPTDFCVAYIERELEDNREKKIWMSRWPVMQRMIDQASNLERMFNELIHRFGYADKLAILYESERPNAEAVWLTLEHIWMSEDFAKEEFIQARTNRRELLKLQENISELSCRLAGMLRRQSELYKLSGFRRHDYQTVIDSLVQGGEHNYLFEAYVKNELESLAYQYDLKYWPSRTDVVEAIGEFEELQPIPRHVEIPDVVLDEGSPSRNPNYDACLLYIGVSLVLIFGTSTSAPRWIFNPSSC
ncbi:hypothetical protein [Vibrio mediterranei]|uniref:hypothetical protein n=1 Tax=Vibrio mediterranei TaxID=689 RepID=UPI0022844B7F|nr:hypothetical protein [Vibrio mediterranei]MCY9855275.1 hypothetical protein [Vibrio mediterranei]